MNGISSFLSGTGAGALTGALLWWTLTALPGMSASRAVFWICAGAVVRCCSAAALLALSVDRGLSSGFWALTGFWLARLAWSAIAWSGRVWQVRPAQSEG